MSSKESHDRDDEILFYLQGRMTTDAREAFEARMQGDPDLAAEVGMLADLRAAMDSPQPEGAADAGWARLERQIAIDERRRTPANANRPLSRPVALWQALGMAAACVALWQLAAVPLVTQGPGPGFAPVSETIAAPALRVRFADDAPAGAINALLYDIGARVIDGPGALGLYLLAFDDDAARLAAETRLKGESALVAMVTRP